MGDAPALLNWNPLLKAPTARVPWTRRHPDHHEDGAGANEGTWRRDGSSSFKSLAATYNYTKSSGVGHLGSWLIAGRAESLRAMTQTMGPAKDAHGELKF